MNFLKNITEVHFGSEIGDGEFVSTHVHFNIEALQEAIGSLKNTSCKKIVFWGDWSKTFCDYVSCHVTPETVKICAANLGWEYKICNRSLQIWEPGYTYRWCLPVH